MNIDHEARERLVREVAETVVRAQTAALAQDLRALRTSVQWLEAEQDQLRAEVAALREEALP